MIAELIDKQDNFEIIRDQIASILATEVSSQMALATAGGKDPDDWKLRIFLERSNAWEQWLNTQSDISPIVNVWFDNSTFNKAASNILERQASTTIFNIDMYGYGESKDLVAGGHEPGDREAALAAAKAIRLVRNILMAAEYTYLGLRGTVWSRWPQAITPFEVQINQGAIQNVVGARLALAVEFNEFSPQIPTVDLELISTVVNESGEVILELDYDYT